MITALKDRLAELPDEEYFPMLVELTAGGAIEELGTGSVVARSNERTLRLIEARLEEFRAAVSEKAGRNVEITLGEPLSSIGGVLVETIDGSVRVDNTFEARIGRLESELRAEIAKALFG